MIKITENLNEANAITHSGTFHADEILATIILSKIYKDVTVFRTNTVPDKLNENIIVYDIGFGKFDHHQKGGNGKRTNGIPFAACGLIWNKFGKEIVKNFENSELVWKIIDKKLISPVDANDNGTIPLLNYPIQDLNFSKLIAAFNPKWDSTENENECFMKAIKFAEIVFENAIYSAISEAKAYSIVFDAIKKSENNILVLDKIVPWKEAIFESDNPKANDILFVVYPSKRGGYNWQCVPDAPRKFWTKKICPSRMERSSR